MEVQRVVAVVATLSKGYDLEYIWKQVDRGPVKDAASYYIQISLSKSISIVHASLGENVRLAREAGDAAGEGYWSGLVAEVDEMIWQAVAAIVSQHLEEALTTRFGLAWEARRRSWL